MNKYILILLLFLLTLDTFAQYTEVINSRRPGFSQSPFSLGTNIYQVESGLFFKKAIDSSTFKNAYGSDIFLRAGLLSERLEFNLDLKVQRDQWQLYDSISNTKNLDNNFGISQMILGAKFMIYMPKYKDPTKEIRSWKRKMAFDWRRLIPSVGIYAGLNTNLLQEHYKQPRISPKAAILLQHDFSRELIWVNNIEADYLTLNDQRNYTYISTLIVSLTERFSLYSENRGTFSKHFKEYTLGGGMAFLLSPDWQIDLNVHRNFNGNYTYSNAGLGLSWRLDRHYNRERNKIDYDKGSGKINRKRKSKLFGKR